MRGDSKRRYPEIAIVELCKDLQHSCKAACLIVANTLPYSPFGAQELLNFAFIVRQMSGNHVVHLCTEWKHCAESI